MKHKFRNVTYKIDVKTPFGGICDAPDIVARLKNLPGIHISEDIHEEAGLIALIHEGLHASNWNKSETDVFKTAEDIGSLLWKLGFRLRKKRK